MGAWFTQAPRSRGYPVHVDTSFAEVPGPREVKRPWTKKSGVQFPAARYCSITRLGIRPRAGTSTLFTRAHSRTARESTGDWVLAGAVELPRTRRAEAANGAIAATSLSRLAELRSISYVESSSEKRTVCCAGVPSRSSLFSTIVLVAKGISL